MRFTRLAVAGSLIAIPLALGGSASASATTPQVSRTPWQMFITPQPNGPLSNHGGGYPHGDPQYYVDANVPVADATAWQGAPDPDLIHFDGTVAGFGGNNASRLGSWPCQTAVDYTYFQTTVTVPAGGTVDQFQVAFNGIDDGARISVYNSAYPQGIIVQGSYVLLGGSSTSDLASYMRVGANRVVVTQLDDCATGNNLHEARIVLNGTVVPPAPADTTPPVVVGSINPATPDGSNGWYRSDVGVSWNVTDSESAVTSRTGCDPTTQTVDTASTTLTCSATSAGGSASASTTFKRDATAPVISGTDVANTAWRNTDLSVDYTASDATSGLASTTDAAFRLTASAESTSPTALTTVSRTVQDQAGNSSTRTLSARIDKTAPTVSLLGAPAAGSTVWSTQAAPTCTASDALSGLGSPCTVTGYSTASGPHTVTASVTDVAGYASSTSVSYTVRTLTSTGYYQPVDMGGVYNVVKGGSTVPLKFNLQIDGAQQTDTALVTAFTATQTGCSTSAPVDNVEITTTGGTILRYDTSGGQYIQNWKTPTGAGTCYRTTATFADGRTLTALFKLK